MEVEKYLWFRGIQQGEIASKLGISQSQLSAICKGRASLPLRLVEPLATLIEAPVDSVVKAFAEVRKVHKGKKGNE